ncbi:MAG: hypothetical protein HYU39_11040 [Thaumarchaeota archaeon]|nr:hypothetical protein [Nitrososphaerota archaeon]
MRSSTVSAKVSQELKRKLRQRQVNISRVIRQALEQEVLKAEEEELRIKLEEIRRGLGSKISKEDTVAAVRASREGR